MAPVRHAVVAVLTLAVVASAGCAGPPSGPAEPAPGTPSATTSAPEATADAPLLSYESVGGMCPTDECRTLLALDRDGAWSLEREDGTGRSGRLDADLLAELTSVVDTADPAALTSRPFTGECERHMDGREVIVTLGPGSASELRLSTCEHVLAPGPLVEPLDRLWEAVMPSG